MPSRAPRLKRLSRSEAKQLGPYRPMPTAASDADELADWLEFWALRPKSRGASIDDLVRLLKRNDSSGFARHDDSDSAEALRLADTAFAVLNRRAAWLGSLYPFEFANNGTRLEARKQADKGLYAFLLALTLAYPTSGHEGTALLFEELCTVATRHLVTGTNGPIQSLRFGSPRLRPAPSKFRDAVRWLIDHLREGTEPHHSAGVHTGDDGLDIVAWRPWRDDRGNQFAVFAQCATGADYEAKVAEIKDKWTQVHFRDALLLSPVRCIFLPRWVPESHWRRLAGYEVLIVDRGRLAESVCQLDRSLSKRIEGFTNETLSGLAS